MLSRFKTVAIWVFVTGLCVCSLVSANEPATLAEAIRVLDLTVFPLVEPVDEPAVRLAARQQYRTKLPLLETAEKIRKQLKDHGCSEAEGATLTDAYGSAMYLKDGFIWSLTLMPDSEPHRTSVTIINHGNLKLDSFPAPPQGKILYAMPTSLAYNCETDAVDVQTFYRKSLMDQGWQPFGETIVSFFVKKNAVVVQVMISSAAPNSAHKSTVQITAELVSVEFPTFDYDQEFQYSDSTCSLNFMSPLPVADFVVELREKLAARKWEATTEDPLVDGFQQELIFRNDAKDYLEVEMRAIDGKTRVAFKYQSAQQFAEAEQRVLEQLNKD
jgi:hypothetical protein